MWTGCLTSCGRSVPSMTEHSSIRQELEERGVLVYTSVGVSMRPLIRQGRDLLVIERPAGRLNNYDIALYQRKTGQYVLHRIVRVEADGYVFCGDNCARREYGITDSQILGVLTGMERGGRQLYLSSPCCRLYGRLWVGLYPLRAPFLYLRDWLRRKKHALERRKPE